jgi:hypothetical protein
MLGSLDERLTEALAQAGASWLRIPGAALFGITHDDEGSRCRG